MNKKSTEISTIVENLPLMLIYDFGEGGRNDSTLNYEIQEK